MREGSADVKVRILDLIQMRRVAERIVRGRRLDRGHAASGRPDRGAARCRGPERACHEERN